MITNQLIYFIARQKINYGTTRMLHGMFGARERLYVHKEDKYE